MYSAFQIDLNYTKDYSKSDDKLPIKTWMKVILAVMCTTWAVVKIRPEKKFRPVRDLNPWPLRYRFFFSGFIFTTAQVVHITARITFIYVTYIMFPDCLLIKMSLDFS